MKIYLENVNTSSNSGPNSFAKKLIPHLQREQCEFADLSNSDVALCFIESSLKDRLKIPRALRLDGIYFNTTQNYQAQNQNIKRTYDMSEGVIYQSNFNKKLIETYFGPHPLSTVIHNGANLPLIGNVAPMAKKRRGDIWCCASQWRPHKRLKDNIRYFLEHKKDDDILIVAGDVADREKVQDKSIAYFGKLSQTQLYSVYKSAKYFVHLAWLDHCPNVVVDARAAGCQIVCSSAGGTREIAGSNSIIIEEDPWDFKPLDLYSPPELDFQRKVKNDFNSEYDMEEVSKKYKSFLEELYRQ